MAWVVAVRYVVKNEEDAEALKVAIEDMVGDFLMDDETVHIKDTKWSVHAL